ncbi:MAG TPA: hypothetical protein VLS96_15900 [Nodosilinea sp.]|nr:hypothetical protein [Nodosilinea sp.]
MAFVTLLATAVGVMSAIALMVVGLVEAPWQLLLLGLLVALYGLQRQVWASDAAGSIGDLTAAPDADLPEPLSTVRAESNSPEIVSASADTYELIYRGIRYRVPKPNCDGQS